MNTKELIKEKINIKFNELEESAKPWDEFGYFDITIKEIKELLEIMDSLNDN